ncbi:MAG: hypothetical protein Q8N08_05985 [Methanobacteriaceae archaeon]|nr:hypothetical protein [Methanobacteriaceae archaeon]
MALSQLSQPRVLCKYLTADEGAQSHEPPESRLWRAHTRMPPQGIRGYQVEKRSFRSRRIHVCLRAYVGAESRTRRVSALMNADLMLCFLKNPTNPYLTNKYNVLTIKFPAPFRPPRNHHAPQYRCNQKTDFRQDLQDRQDTILLAAHIKKNHGARRGHRVRLKQQVHDAMISAHEHVGKRYIYRGIFTN